MNDEPIIKGGLTPLTHDHRDFDFLKTKKLQGVVPTFPDSYCTDVGLWMPDQNADGQPYGCTNYAQTDLLIDEDKKLYNPMDLENITHANANGGSDLRTSLKAVVKLHPDHPVFFNVQPDIDKGGYIDWFDAVRIAIVVGKIKNRAVTIGTPWFHDFESTGPSGVVPTPLSWSLAGVGWHDWCGKGWETINGNIYLTCKSWQGRMYGNGGYCYFSRPLFNQLMSIGGTGAFVLDKLLPGETPQKIDSSVAQLLVSFFTQLLKRVGL